MIYLGVYIVRAKYFKYGSPSIVLNILLPPCSEFYLFGKTDRIASEKMHPPTHQRKMYADIVIWS